MVEIGEHHLRGHISEIVAPSRDFRVEFSYLFVVNYLMEVCLLSCGMMFQSLSPPLQRGVRFLHRHLPTSRSVALTIDLPPLAKPSEETFGLTVFRTNNFDRFRTHLSTGGATSV